jgi:hypothetical protein
MVSYRFGPLRWAQIWEWVMAFGDTVTFSPTAEPFIERLFQDDVHSRIGCGRETLLENECKRLMHLSNGDSRAGKRSCHHFTILPCSVVRQWRSM